MSPRIPVTPLRDLCFESIAVLVEELCFRVAKQISALQELQIDQSEDNEDPTSFRKLAMDKFVEDFGSHFLAHANSSTIHPLIDSVKQNSDKCKG